MEKTEQQTVRQKFTEEKYGSQAAQQLALRLSSRPLPTFGNFIEPEEGQVTQIIQQFLANAEETILYLSGERASGKTHLLTAAVHGASDGNAVYLSMKELLATSPELLEGLEFRRLICIDDIDLISGKGCWQQALFHLFNRCQNTGSKWLVAGLQQPVHSGVELADLRSRLNWGVVIRLSSLGDEQCLTVLDQQARHFGLKLSAEVKHYIIRRAPRDLNSLTDLLYRLEQASLQNKKPVTIPFIKSQTGW